MKHKSIVVDIEADGLLESASRMHVASLSYFDEDTGEYGVTSVNTPQAIIEIIKSAEIVVGHNFYMYDIPVLEKLTGEKIPLDNIVDTLFLSWYIEPGRPKHGLESYGEEYDVEKPAISDWENLSYEQYRFRCEEDVKINTILWHKQLERLHNLYGEDVMPIITFLMTKARVYKTQQENPLRLNVIGARRSLTYLEQEEAKRIEDLAKDMPQNPIKKKKQKPKVMYKKDGSLSAHGQAWMELLERQGIDQDVQEIEYVDGHEPPNPGSTSQIKDWLFSLGWEPTYYKETQLKSGATNRVPQTKGKDGDLCPSVKKLIRKEPSLASYEDLGVIQHRIGLVKGLLRDVQPGGFIQADLAGLTNTLRIRHRTLVNLPAVSQKFGEHIRPHLLPPEGHLLIGADLSSLENTTRNHFVYPLDPAFVETQSHPYYDPHLEIAVTAGMMSESEASFYKYWKAYKKDNTVTLQDIGGPVEDVQIILDSYDDPGKNALHDKLDGVRQAAKTTNYSAMYGVGKSKLSKELGITPYEAGSLLDAYWRVNWSVKKFASTCNTKLSGGQMWVQNPLNNFWYSLRSEKDIFSTVNQGAGDFIHTLWEYFILQAGVVIHGNFHDEIITSCPKDQVEQTVARLYEAIDKVNEVLNMNVPVGIDHKVGTSYGDVH